MKNHIDKYGRLVFTVSKKEQKELRRDCERYDFDSDRYLHEFLDVSEYEWLIEGFTNDLTMAPMLGLFNDGKFVKRWAFMSYQVTSPQRELAEKGECIWEF